MDDLSERQFVDQYEPVFRQLEGAIVGHYRKNPELLDADVDQVCNALYLRYRSIEKGRKPRERRMSPRAAELFAVLEPLCSGWLEEAPAEWHGPLSPAELQRMMKRIQKSIKLWTQEGGRQGYLAYVDQFFPG